MRVTYKAGNSVKHLARVSDKRIAESPRRIEMLVEGARKSSQKLGPEALEQPLYSLRCEPLVQPCKRMAVRAQKAAKGKTAQRAETSHRLSG